MTDAGVSGAAALLISTFIDFLLLFLCLNNGKFRLRRRSLQTFFDCRECRTVIRIDRLVPMRHDIRVLVPAVGHEPGNEPDRPLVRRVLRELMVILNLMKILWKFP